MESNESTNWLEILEKSLPNIKNMEMDQIMNYCAMNGISLTNLQQNIINILPTETIKISESNSESQTDNKLEINTIEGKCPWCGSTE